jgi:anhydro-N-acetylmuramic acid kinase
MRVIGLMSGTSLDGVDAALIETDGHTVQAFGPALTIPYERSLRADLRRLIDLGEAAPAAMVADAETQLTRVHGQAVAAVGGEADLIGFHGQTILHAPQRRRTWQIGDANLLARLTGVPVACDFRLADVAAGGQGAPFVPVLHGALAAGLARPLLVVNIGGVSNITLIRADGSLLACDTGPGNALLDDWMSQRTGQAMDEDGRLAAAGTPDEAILGRLLADPFFRLPAPKSLDRQHFAHALPAIAGLSTQDGAATLAAFTARAIAAAPLPEPPARVLVTGGGRHNKAIMAVLGRAMAAPVGPVEEVGWDGDALEAQCFGFLAARVRHGLPLSFPGTTGVPHPMLGGRIVSP